LSFQCTKGQQTPAHSEGRESLNSTSDGARSVSVQHTAAKSG
jgi:hypothetical protein